MTSPPPRARPGDHPDFFRWPAPEGRSRESEIRLDAEGRFFHEGALVEHPGLAAALHAWIDRHPDDGRPILTNGWDWTYFVVDDVPLFIRSVDEDGTLSLSNGRSEPLAPARVVEGAHGALYVTTASGLEAKFTRSAQASLAPFLVEVDGGVALSLGGAVCVPRPRGAGER